MSLAPVGTKKDWSSSILSFHGMSYRKRERERERDGRLVCHRIWWTSRLRSLILILLRPGFTLKKFIVWSWLWIRILSTIPCSPGNYSRVDQLLWSQIQLDIKYYNSCNDNKLLIPSYRSQAFPLTAIQTLPTSHLASLFSHSRDHIHPEADLKVSWVWAKGNRNKMIWCRFYLQLAAKA